MNVNASCALPGWGKAGWCSTPEPSYLVAHHPDWLAWDGPTGSGKTSLVDLGIPEAREYTVDFLTDAIGSWQIDTFRIESSCNGGQDCVVFFQDHDRTYQQRKYPGVARNGTTEIGHTLGLHAVFDEIRMRHPGLVVDVCAGGGRKIDLDIMERSVQKWQSDFTGEGLSDPLQGHLMGEQHYQPLSSAGIWSSDPYTWRSVATTGGLIFWDQRNDTEAERNRTAAAIAETKRLRPLVLQGDFFVLTNLDGFGWSNMSADASSWAAWQWANATQTNGAAVFFRRGDAPASTTVTLNYVDKSAVYELRHFESYSLAKAERCSGAKLAHLEVSIAANSSLLLEYERV